MAGKGQQIRNILIRAKSQGTREVVAELDAIDNAINSINSKLSSFETSFTRTMNKMVTQTATATAGVVNLSRELGAMNERTRGSTQAVVGDLADVTASLNRVENQARQTNAAMDSAGVDDSFQNVHIENMSESLTELVIELRSLNVAADDTNRILRQVRNNVGDNGAAADRTTEEIEAMASAMHGSNTEARQGVRSQDAYNNSLQGLSSQGRNSTRAFSSLAFTMNPLTSLYAKVAINVFAASEAFRVLNEAANFGRLEESTASFSSSLSGINVKSLAKDMQEASMGALSLKEALVFATKGVAFDFTSKQLNELTAATRKASIALGRDFSDSMDRVLRGISKQEIELFDEIGVVTKLTTAFENFTKGTDRTIDSLTEQERQLAVTVEVLDQLEGKFSSVGAQVTSWERLGVAVKDFSNIALKGVAKSMGDLVGDFADFLKIITPTTTSLQLANESLETAATALDSGKIIQAANATVQAQGLLASATIEVAEGLEGANTIAVIYKSSIDTLTLAISAAAAAMIVLNSTIIIAKLSAIGPAIMDATISLAGFTTAVGASILALRVWWATLLAPVSAIAATIATVVVVFAAIVAAVSWVIDGIVGWVDGMVNATETSKDLAEAVAGQEANLKLLTEAGFDVVGMNEENIASALAWQKSLNSTSNSIVDLANGLGKINSTPVGDLAQEFEKLNNLKPPKILEGDAGTLKILREEFAALKSSGIIPQSTKDAASWAHVLRVADEVMIGFAHSTSMLGKGLDFNLASPLDAANAKLKQHADALKLVTDVDASYAKGLRDKVQLLEMQVRIETQLANSNKAKAKIDNSSSTRDLGLEFSPETKTSDKTKSNLLALQQTQSSEIVKLSEEESTALATTIRQTKLKLSMELNREKGQVRLASLSIEQARRDAKANQSFELVSAKKIIADQAGIDARMEKLTLSRNIGIISKEEFDNSKAILDFENKLLATTRDRQGMLQATAMANSQELIDLEATAHLESDILALKIEQLKAKEAELSSSGKNTDDLQAKIAGLEQVKKAQIGKEEVARAKALLNLELQSIKNHAFLLNSATLLNVNKQKELDVERKLNDIETDKAAKEVEKSRIASEQITVDKEKKAAPFTDASTVFQASQGLEGLSGMQSAALGLASDFSDSYAGFLKSDASSLTDFLSGDLDTFLSSTTAVANAATSVFQELSSAKVDGIDREIAAEKKRDGKSAESLAKIKALNVKKIKEEAKAKKASVLMSTATGIMQAYASMDTISASYAAAGIAVLGAVQLANISKAASGQIADLGDGGGGGSKMKITGGNRDNSVNVDATAKASELSGMRGGRAGGGFVGAGTGVLVGERGPEFITPEMPSNVETAGNSKGNKGTNVTFAPVINVNALDTQSIIDRSADIYEALEVEVNAKLNTSLERLGGAT